jgi:hypothetical protein
MNINSVGAVVDRAGIGLLHVSSAARIEVVPATRASSLPKWGGRLMRCIASGLALLAVTGCASQPAQPDSAVAAQSPQTQAERATLASALDAENRAGAANLVSAAAGLPAGDANPEALTLAKARKLGYRIVDRNGETVYCHDSSATGTRLGKQTVCLTQEQWDNVSRNAAREVEKMQRNTFPCPSGARQGGCGG